MRMPRIGLAFAGITAGLLTLFGINAEASTPHTHTADCNRVAKADRPLCHTVQKQPPYRFATASAIVTTPAGRTLVHDITHDQLTRTEMSAALYGEHFDYRIYAGDVKRYLATARQSCGTDGQIIIGFRDTDGKPGGDTVPRVEIDCP